MDKRLRTTLLIGGLAVGAYLLYRWYQNRQQQNNTGAGNGNIFGLGTNLNSVNPALGGSGPTEEINYFAGGAQSTTAEQQVQAGLNPVTPITNWPAIVPGYIPTGQNPMTSSSAGMTWQGSWPGVQSNVTGPQSRYVPPPLNGTPTPVSNAVQRTPPSNTGTIKKTPIRNKLGIPGGKNQ